MSELWQLSAIELARRIKSRDVSSREVIEAHLARIEAVNSKVNAITVVLAESALEAADKADDKKPHRSLHGVPFTITTVEPTSVIIFRPSTRYGKTNHAEAMAMAATIDKATVSP